MSNPRCCIFRKLCFTITCVVTVVITTGWASLLLAEDILSPLEAAKQAGKTVTVELFVNGAGLNPPIDSEELYSEPMWRHSDAFIIRFIGPVRSQLKDRNVLSVGEHFMHHKLRATGKVKQLTIDGEVRPAIDLASLDDVEFVDGATWPEKPPPTLGLDNLKKRKVDLRPALNRYRLEPRQQGHRGACQVFALTGVAEYHLAKQGRKTDLSEMFLMWSANEATQTTRVDGFNPDLLIAGWRSYGVCSENLQPYIGKNEPIAKPSEKAIQEAATRLPMDLVLIKHWSSGYPARDDHLQRLLEELQSQNPVSVTLAWPGGIRDDEILDRNMLFVERDESTWNKQGHGTVFVGYEINKQFDGGAVFIFRNSWGADWGEKGYGKISLALARKLILDIYALVPRKAPLKPPRDSTIKPSKAVKAAA